MYDVYKFNMTTPKSGIFNYFLRGGIFVKGLLFGLPRIK